MALTDALDIDEVADNQASWEATVDDALNRLARSVNTTLEVALVANTATISADDFHMNGRFRVTGASADASLIVPQKVRRFLVTNNTSFGLNVHMPTGAGIILSANTIADLISDSADLAIVQGTGVSGTAGYGGLPAEVQNAPMSFPFGGKPVNAQVFHVPLTQAYTLPANFAGTIGYPGTVATSNAVFAVGYVRSGSYTAIGTLTFLATASALTLSTQAAVNLLATDIIRMTAPSPQDVSLADCGITIMFKKV